jgi:hypothetical protein
MSTLHEIKVAAAGLPVEERSELVTWLSEAKDMYELRREQLRRVAPLDMTEIKAKARARWETEQRG